MERYRTLAEILASWATVAAFFFLAFGTWQTQDTVRAAQEQLKISREELQNSQEQLKTTQDEIAARLRPWVGRLDMEAEGFETMNCGFTPDPRLDVFAIDQAKCGAITKFSFVYFIKNYGALPAKNLQQRRVNSSSIDSLLEKLRQSTPGKPALLFPGEEVPARFDVPAIDIVNASHGKSWFVGFLFTYEYGGEKGFYETISEYHSGLWTTVHADSG
ncbi:MAG: hypothetical protein HYU39_08570 [Thaumarchaeota archaeon]|nr:hypothetical protein [Nitrososphaerota archaeon]